MIIISLHSVQKDTIDQCLLSPCTFEHHNASFGGMHVKMVMFKTVYHFSTFANNTLVFLLPTI